MEEQPPQQPPNSELQKAYETLLKRRAYCADYMKKFRQEHKEEWNAQARKRYAKKKAAKQNESNSQFVVDNQ